MSQSTMGIYFRYTYFYGHLVWSPVPLYGTEPGITITRLDSNTSYYAIHVPGMFVTMSDMIPQEERDSWLVKIKASLEDTRPALDLSLNEALSRLNIVRRRPGEPTLILVEECSTSYTDPWGYSRKYFNCMEDLCPGPESGQKALSLSLAL